jgi:hypothetical protein
LGRRFAIVIGHRDPVADLKGGLDCKVSSNRNILLSRNPILNAQVELVCELASYSPSLPIGGVIDDRHTDGSAILHPFGTSQERMQKHR